MAQETILIIDYGSGNLRSAAKAFEHVIDAHGLDARVVVSGDADDVRGADRIVLPGQGAFRDCMDNLQGTDGMIAALEARVLHDGVPFLGICVGMQLLATRGMEHGVTAGLDWISGQVVPFNIDPALKIPHMGWNTLIPPNSGQDNLHPVLRGSIESSAKSADHYYFVHSFMFECEYAHHILGLTDYGGLYPCAVGRDNIVGVQFHPEKSQDAGLALIHNFINWKP